MIGPRLDGVAVAFVLEKWGMTDPAIIVEEPHRRLAPFLGVFGPVEEHGAQHVMPVADDIGPDRERVAGNALHGMTAAIELGIDLLDENARAGRPIGMEPPRGARRFADRDGTRRR